MSDDTLDSYMDRVVISKPAVLTPVCPAQLIFRNKDQVSQITREEEQKYFIKHLYEKVLIWDVEEKFIFLLLFFFSCQGKIIASFLL